MATQGARGNSLVAGTGSGLNADISQNDISQNAAIICSQTQPSEEMPY